MNLEPYTDPRHALLVYPGLCTLRVVKNSYGFYPPEVELVRRNDLHGALRLAAEEDLAAYREAVAAAEKSPGGRGRSRKGKRAETGPTGAPPNEGPEPDYDELPF